MGCLNTSGWGQAWIASLITAKVRLHRPLTNALSAVVASARLSWIWASLRRLTGSMMVASGPWRRMSISSSRELL